MKVSKFNWDNLEEDYKELGSQSAVAEKYGCSQSAVHLQMKNAGLKTPPRNHWGEKNPKWRGGRRIDSDGYVQIYTPDHPNRTVRNEVPEHRLIIEKHLGRYLKPEEVMHHKNGIKDDNRIENLELHDSNGSHAKLHLPGLPRDLFNRAHSSLEAVAKANKRIIASRNKPTPRQKQVLDLWVEGKEREQIAETLGFTTKAVHYHLTELFKKGLIKTRVREGRQEVVI